MTSIAQQIVELDPNDLDSITGAHTVYDSPWSEQIKARIQRIDARRDFSDAIRRKDTRDQHKAQKALTDATTACLIAEAGLGNA